MESRRVILLTKGFLHGWLDFKAKTPLSKLRENYILNWIESEEIKEIAHLRAITDATIASGIKTPEVIKLAFDAYDRYRELALPYMSKKRNIELEGSSKQQMLKQLKELHKKNKSIFGKLKKLVENKEPVEDK